jgi:hypothetical protein
MALEIIYARSAAEHGMHFAPFLLLPTLTTTELCETVHSANPQYSHNLHLIRARLQQDEVQGVGALRQNGNHFTAYFYRKSTGTLSLFDSLRDKNPDVAMLTGFRWLLRGTTLTQPREIKTLPTPIQGSFSGSCGAASLNFLQQQIGQRVTPWLGDEQSPEIRDYYLDMVLGWNAISSGRIVSAIPFKLSYLPYAVEFSSLCQGRLYEIVVK